MPDLMNIDYDEWLYTKFNSYCYYLNESDGLQDNDLPPNPTYSRSGFMWSMDYEKYMEKSVMSDVQRHTPVD
jgi:hypothetical protein